ncbi:MAG: FimB/Mfa2 family fimbrial subunit [Prevotellaceae bacterium]|nr:FimB/Mfa2 family fimbrial subunit [Prevotellaceae bacterium]
MCLTLTFNIEDQYASDNFDSRIGNDILLTAFRGGGAVWSEVIPYERIHNGECTIKKPDGLDGNVTFVAWAAPKSSATPAIYTPLPSGTSFDNFFFEQTAGSVAGGLAVPETFHFGTDSVAISADEPTNTSISLKPVTCRVEVRVHSEKAPDQTPTAVINGTASRANLEGKGSGGDKAVVAAFLNPSSSLYTTNIVPVMPSPDGQSVSVTILDGTETVATLSAPASVTRVAAQSGGYILFDYTVNTASVTITVEDWQIAGTVTVNNM